MPRVCTRITRCANFMADNFTPWLILGAHTNSNMRALELESVVHEAGLFRLTHLSQLFISVMKIAVIWCAYKCRKTRG